MYSEGYISEIDYIYGYFAEQSPARIRLALLARGVANNIGPTSSYLELGFGQGLTLAVSAATSDGEYHGTDVNPSQASSAQRLTDASGRAVRIYEDSFEELAERDDLPQFDIISLHGIWSWVSDDSRDAIVRIARRNLKPGGVLYISYNVTPGWSPATPLRQLLSEYSKRAATGPILSRVEQSLSFVQSVIDADADYFRNNPSLAHRLANIRKQDKTYVSHEFFNQNWHPMSFVEISDRLSAAKLGFGASANLIDNLEALSVPAAARPLLDKIGDESLRQMVRDFFVSQQFRRDLFVKGVRHMTRGELRHEIAGQEFLLVGDPDQRPAKIMTPAGEAELKADIYEPIGEQIVSDPDTPVSVPYLLSAPRTKHLGEWQIWEALLVLAAANWLSPRNFGGATPATRAASHSLNQEILRRAEYGESIACLASPEIGAAIPVTRIEQLLLAAHLAGDQSPVDAVFTKLEGEGERLISEGKVVEDREAALMIMNNIWQELIEKKLPTLRRLGAVAA
jgi:SAM-dependent methyltransferase